MLDKTDATRLLTKIRRQWFAKRKSIAAILKEVMTNEASTLLDTDAANKAADADMALQELGSDEIGQAYVTATVTVWDEDAGTATEKLRLVEKVIEGRDFTCIPETVNAIEAWLGSLPGHVYANVRQPPVSTLNLAHMMPLSAVWAGPERDDHFDAPPLFLARTEGSTPFRFSLHVGDVGHTLIIGPTGAGKSVLLALMALQFRRYAGAQIFAFDFGGSIRAAALAMGGDWHDLGGALSEDAEEPVALQPLARIDEYVEEAWAAEWIEALLAREGVTITPDAKEHIWSAVTSLASAPVSERTLTGLSVLLQSNALKQALQPYCLGGPFGRLLDAEAERLGAADVQVFETEGLIGRGAAPAVLSYLFHRIEGRLDGRPTLLIIDEGWLALDDTGFARQLREWLKTLRKKNASVIFATQSLADIETSAIAPALIESCPTRIFLPNERAIEPQITTIYRRFGLNDRQIEIISRATPKRDYYCQSRRGNRLFELGIGRRRARSDRRLLQIRPGRHCRRSRHRRPREFRVRLAGGQRRRLGRRSSPQHDSRGLVMSHKNQFIAVAPVLAIILAMAVGTPVRAQMLVFDPSNYSQNLLTAARSLQQIQNQIKSLQNEAQMLINQAKQLEQLPTTVLNDVERDYSQIQTLLKQANGITYNVQSLNQAYAQRYPVSISSATSDLQMIASAQQRWQDSLSAFQHSLTLGAGAVQNLPNTQAQTASLLASSQSSVGILQATQAGNQLVAVQTRQLADLTALLAAQGRAQALEQARKAEAEGQAQEQLRRFLSPGQGYQPQPVQMFH